MTYLHQVGGINCSGKQQWGQGAEANQHPHCLGKQNMGRIWQLLTLCVTGEGGKTDFEMSEFQRLSVSIPQSAFWEGDLEFQHRARSGCSESQDRQKSGRRQEPGETPFSQNRRGTFLVWSQVLLSPGFIPHNAKHQKATLKDTDNPKA